MILYIKDILLIDNDVGLLSSVKIWLFTQFKMKDLGEAQYILEIKVFRDCKNKKLALQQATYIDKFLVKYEMQDSKKGLLLFRHGIPLSQYQCPETLEEKERMQSLPYVSIVGILMYVMLHTRLDICFTIDMVSRYQSNPGLEH